MSARLQGVLVAAIGLIAMGLAVGGTYRDYLKPAMRLPLLATGGVLLLLGLVTLVRALVTHRPSVAAVGEGHDHDHHAHGGPKVAWLLVALLVTILIVRPPALGADAARRDTASAFPEPRADRVDPLPAPRAGAVDLTLRAFLNRAYFDDDESLAGIPVRLVGFVVRDPEITDGYQLTRFVMICCAGDAFPAHVAVHGLDGPPPPDDTWVEVVGQWIPPADPNLTGHDRGGAVDLISQTPIPAPTDPYE